MKLPMEVLTLSLLSLSSALVCPDGGVCEDRNTCCKNAAGGYGCCPLPHAECCSDHLHCCFQGTVCDLIHQRCVNKTTSLPWMRKLPANQSSPSRQLRPSANAVICPDHESECPDGSTCCQLRDQSWGCCPFEKAVCCEDKRHCCPEGAKCDLEHYKCVFPSLKVFPMMEKTVSATRTKRPAGGTSVTSSDRDASSVRSVVCPGGRGRCPVNDSCCELTTGDHGCCPYQQAVCCDDHLHCCPHGSTCNLAASSCDLPAGGAVLSRLGGPPSLSPQSVHSKCDESTSCPGKSTCCKTEGGAWGCCPLPQAVCCDDHVHCCPHGSVCNSAAQTCDDPSGSSPSAAWTRKTPAETQETPAVAVRCDTHTMCPRGTTCCQKEGGQWACCPLPQAVCCDDHEHCCPEGYECNVTEQTCDKPGAVGVPWLRKTPPLRATPLQPGSAPVQRVGNACDAVTSCPEETSCCFMERSHQWGCCPLPEAVCCEDGDHCCPKGHRCDPRRSSCSQGSRILPWFTKLSARAAGSASVADVKCDDKSSCASGTTCCKLLTGDWGCCPLVKAVCCDDHEHCCPQSYTCNMQTGTCEKNLRYPLPRAALVPAVPVVPHTHAATVPCDSTGGYRCPRTHTCCQISESEWSCCPSPQAVCCSGSGCCPSGSFCDLKSRSCRKPRLLTWNTNTHSAL